MNEGPRRRLLHPRLAALVIRTLGEDLVRTEPWCHHHFIRELMVLATARDLGRMGLFASTALPLIHQEAGPGGYRE